MFFHTVLFLSLSLALSLSLDSHVGHRAREYTVYAGLRLIKKQKENNINNNNSNSNKNDKNIYEE